VWPATGPAPAAGGLVADVAVGQRLLQFGDARVRDRGALEVETLQIRHPLEVHQTLVGDVSFIAKAKALQVDHVRFLLVPCGGGTGLGLVIVRSLVEDSMQDKVQIFLQPGSTSVQVYLPAPKSSPGRHRREYREVVLLL
jgi:hypothetical protein